MPRHLKPKTIKYPPFLALKMDYIQVSRKQKSATLLYYRIIHLILSLRKTIKGTVVMFVMFCNVFPYLYNEKH